STPRSAHAACRLSSARAMAPAGSASSSVNSAASWAGLSGWLDASSAASTIRVICVWSMLIRFLPGPRPSICARVVGGFVIELAAEGDPLRVGAGCQRPDVDGGRKQPAIRGAGAGGLLDDLHQLLLGQRQHAE